VFWSEFQVARLEVLLVFIINMVIGWNHLLAEAKHMIVEKVFQLRPKWPFLHPSKTSEVIWHANKG